MDELRWQDSPEEPHELRKFLLRASLDLASEYQRIHARSREDPGTAGDEGEEDWAELLRMWLPAYYPVVTKGRLLGRHGQASSQVDLLVLSPAYPTYLQGKKLYLADAVVAAFECKLTLRPGQLRKAQHVAASLRALLDDNKEHQAGECEDVDSSLIYGVLAHSSAYLRKDDTELAARRCFDELADAASIADIQHPRDAVDLVCVADLAAVSARRSISEYLRDRGTNPLLLEYRLYVHGHPWVKRWGEKRHYETVNIPIAISLYDLMSRLAKSDSAMKPIAAYFGAVLDEGAGGGIVRSWPLAKHEPSQNPEPSRTAAG